MKSDNTKTKHGDTDALRSEGDLNLSPSRAAWQSARGAGERDDWLREDERYFLHQSLSTPCLDILKSAQGATLETVDGERILDFHGNNVHQVGFGHPRVLDAIRLQLDSLPFCTRRFTNAPAVTLARRLTSLAPGNLNKILFAPSGTAVVGIALKLARAATGRHKTISLWDSFHGASLDAISVGGEAVFRKDAGPLLPGAEHAPPPHPPGCPFQCGNECNLQCAKYIEYMLEKEGDVAAVIAETVRSTPYIPPPEYWNIVRRACDRHGALLILDEIPHLGRSGKMFTCEHYGVVPDMLVIGKGLGGGVFPLAALIAKEELDVAPQLALGHYTHEKNPVACAAALAVLDVIAEEKLLQRATELGEHTLKRLNAMAKKFPAIAGVRGIGLLLGVELQDLPQSNTTATELAEQVMYGCLSRGLSFKISMGNTLTLTPPLTVTRDELNRALNILEESLEDATRAR